MLTLDASLYCHAGSQGSVQFNLSVREGTLPCQVNKLHVHIYSRLRSSLEPKQLCVNITRKEKYVKHFKYTTAQVNASINGEIVDYPCKPGGLGAFELGSLGAWRPGYLGNWRPGSLETWKLGGLGSLGTWDPGDLGAWGGRGVETDCSGLQPTAAKLRVQTPPRALARDITINQITMEPRYIGILVWYIGILEYWRHNHLPDLGRRIYIYIYIYLYMYIYTYMQTYLAS